MFLRVAFLPCRLQHGQKLGGLGAVGGGIILGHTGVFNEERSAVQGGVCRFYGKRLLVKADRPCYNGGGD